MTHLPPFVLIGEVEEAEYKLHRQRTFSDSGLLRTLGQMQQKNAVDVDRELRRLCGSVGESC